MVRLDFKIKELGVIEVLRKGIKHIDKAVILKYGTLKVKVQQKVDQVLERDGSLKVVKT
jgi:hypothetical protein